MEPKILTTFTIFALIKSRMEMFWQRFIWVVLEMAVMARRHHISINFQI